MAPHYRVDKMAVNLNANEDRLAEGIGKYHDYVSHAIIISFKTNILDWEILWETSFYIDGASS